MFIEVVHINGTYNPDTQQHTPTPDMQEVIPRLQAVTGIVARNGWDVLYTPNLNGNAGLVIGDAEATDAALASDPFLSGLDAQTREKVITRLDGLGQPSEYNIETIAIEDGLALRHWRGFVLGAFTTDCVLAAAKNIMARNPGTQMMVDTAYCVERSGQHHGPLDLDGVRVDSISSHLPPTIFWPGGNQYNKD